MIITIGRKPSTKSITDTVLERGCGAINTNQSRISGRYPANFILQTETATTLDEQSGILKSGALSSKQYEKDSENNRSLFFGVGQTFKHRGYGANEGGASRYFKVIQ